MGPYSLLGVLVSKLGRLSAPPRGQTAVMQGVGCRQEGVREERSRCCEESAVMRGGGRGFSGEGSRKLGVLGKWGAESEALLKNSGWTVITGRGNMNS